MQKFENTVAVAQTEDAGKVRWGAGFRLPEAVADAGKVRWGAGFRLPEVTA